MDLDPPPPSSRAPGPLASGAVSLLKKSAKLKRVAIVALIFALSGTALMISSLVYVLSGDAVMTAGAFWLVGLTAVLAFIAAVARELLYWRLPVRHLSHIVHDIRLGKLPIAELDKAYGGAKRLVPALRDLLIDRREIKRQMQIISVESRRKVASTVDSFERKLSAVQNKAARDCLTGLYNRRTLDEMLQPLLDRARQTGHDAGVLMVDVDHFKTLNDTLGHAQGDEFLRQLSQIIRSVLRSPGDMGFRFGGDEFVLLFLDADDDELQNIGRRLKQMVDTAAIAFKVEPRPSISTGGASIGFTGSTNAQDLLRRADTQLYEAKHARAARRTTRPAA